MELTWQSSSSWINLILTVSHSFTHTAGSSLCTSQSERLSRGSEDSRLVSKTDNQMKKFLSFILRIILLFINFLNATD